MSIATACPPPSGPWVPVEAAARLANVSIRDVWAALSRGVVWAMTDSVTNPGTTIVLREDLAKIARRPPRSS